MAPGRFKKTRGLNLKELWNRGVTKVKDFGHRVGTFVQEKVLPTTSKIVDKAKEIAPTVVNLADQLGNEKISGWAHKAQDGLDKGIGVYDKYSGTVNQVAGMMRGKR